MDRAKVAKLLKKLNIPLSIFALVVVAFVLRTLWLQDNLFFGWEQGRDFLKYREILSGDLVLVGPKTDIPGVFHGALSYYIPLIPFWIFKGDPLSLLLTYIAINSLAILFLYKAVVTLINKRTALFTSIFYAVSYSSVIYARWLSNPSLIPALVIFYIYFLVKAKDNWGYLILSAVLFATMVHLIVVVPVSLIVPTLVLIKHLKVRLDLKSVLISTFTALVVLSPYFIFEIRNNFVMAKSLLANRSVSGNFLTSNIGFVDQFFNEVVDGVFPVSPRLAFIVFILLLFYGLSRVKSISVRKMTLTLLFSVPILFLFISNSPLRHFHIATPVFLSIFLGVIVATMLENKNSKTGYVVVVVVTIGNLYAIHSRLPESKANFIHHSQRTYLSDMKKLVDWVYDNADGDSFSYNYYSVPYWKEEAWKYMFVWYGWQKYGYLPVYDRTRVFYTLMEPNESIPVHRDNWYGEFKKGTKLLGVYKSGELTAEKRLVENTE